MIAEKYDLIDKESVDEEHFHEMHHVEDPTESAQAFVLPAHEDEEMVSFNDTNDFMEDLSDTVDQHIDYFIHVERSGWDIGCYSFGGDPIYDIEGGFRVKNDKLFSPECLSTCLYGSNVWQHDDDMVMDLFRPPKDDWLQYIYVDFQPFLGDCPF
jgi:hypothetical protein